MYKINMNKTDIINKELLIMTGLTIYVHQTT